MPEDTTGLPRLEPLKTARAGVLDVAYYEAGPADGAAVLLLHGFPYDIHSYVQVIPRLAAEDMEKQLAALPPITVPAITLDGQAGGPNFPATDGAASAHHFTGPRTHRQVPGAGHNLPQEAPEAFATAVLDLASPGRARR